MTDSESIVRLTSPKLTYVENSLDEDEIKSIVSKLRSMSDADWGYNEESNDVWNGMAVSAYQVAPDFVYENLGPIKWLIENDFGTSIEPVNIQFTRWKDGRAQGPHLDFFDENEDHDYDKLLEYGFGMQYLREFGKNFKSYHFVSLLYLNDDFSGGELYFPQHENFTIKPRPGLLAVFSGDENHLHGVTPVNDGTRYAFSVFWKNH